MLRVEASFHRQYSKFMPLLISDILSVLSQVKVINKIGTLSYFLLTYSGYCTCFGRTYTKIGTIQRRLAWPLRKDDTQIREAFHIFTFFPLSLIANSFVLLQNMQKDSPTLFDTFLIK